MDNVKMGRFITEQRKSQQLTQKELADKLNVSDKAVSKWERGVSCPDISLVVPLSDILGVTATELLNGEKAGSEDVNVESVVVNALEYAEETGKRRVKLNLNIIAAVYSVLLLIGIFVVLVVNLAVSGGITWSLIPISSCVFAWLVFIPAIKLGSKGIVASLISFSVFIIPFLFTLDYTVERLLGSDTLLFPMGIRIAPLTIVFQWAVYFLFKKLKTRVLLAVAVAILLTSPLTYFVNSMIANMLGVPYNGLEMVLNTLSPIIVAAVLFVIEFILRKRAA